MCWGQLTVQGRLSRLSVNHEVYTRGAEKERLGLRSQAWKEAGRTGHWACHLHCAHCAPSLPGCSCGAVGTGPTRLSFSSAQEPVHVDVSLGPCGRLRLVPWPLVVPGSALALRALARLALILASPHLVLSHGLCGLHGSPPQGHGLLSGRLTIPR